MKKFILIFFLPFLMKPNKDSLIRVINASAENNKYEASLILSYLYDIEGKKDSAEYYFHNSLGSIAGKPDKLMLIFRYARLGDTLSGQNKHAQAELYYQMAMDTARYINSDYGIAMSCSKMGANYVKQKKFVQAIQAYSQAIEKNIKLKTTSAIRSNLEGITKAYAGMGDIYQCSFYFDSVFRYTNRLKETEHIKILEEQKAKLETEKADIQILKNKSDLSALKENKKIKRILLFTVVGFAVSLIFGIIMMILYVNKKKYSFRLQQQNLSLESKILERQNQQKTSSIHKYAQKIQSAALTGDGVWKRFTKEYFILFQPKEIVSGDFYWSRLMQNGRAIFAVADCEEHGVVGGLTAMLVKSFLTEIVVENKIFSAPKILQLLHEKITRTTDKNDNAFRPFGINIALCVWNKMDNSLEFAGAKNNLYVFRKGNITELKGNSMTIGNLSSSNSEFDAQIFQLEKGDSLYMATDGFANQIGGPKENKYGDSQFRSVLEAIQDIDLKLQEEILLRDINDWKGPRDQTDDVCVIGIKV